MTHKEHRQLLSELYKRQGGKWIYQADAYIKQQERDSELLELYKELATLYRDRFDYNNSATEIKRLWVKIKEKENE